MNLEFRERSVREILDALTHPLGYRWSMVEAVVSVTHDGALVEKWNLLNTRIPQFRIGRRACTKPAFALSLHLYFVLNPKVVESQGILRGAIWLSVLDPLI